MNTVIEDLCVLFCFFAAGVLMMMEKLWTALICWQRSVPCFFSFPVHHIIIIMEICKAPTLWLKALTKHSIMHIMYIEMENVIRKKERKTTHIM